MKARIIEAAGASEASATIPARRASGRTAFADHCIFGSGSLHDRFHLATEILCALLWSAPCPQSEIQLQRSTGRSAREIRASCKALQRAALAQPERKVRGNWRLARAPHTLTLEDAFLCAVGHQLRSANPAAEAGRESCYPGIDLLVMQATMAVNQDVRNTLKQFSLDRFKVNTRVMPHRIEACAADAF